MADTYEAYELHVAAYRSEELTQLIQTSFGDAVELDWRDSFDTDASFEAYVNSDRKDEFTTLIKDRFGDDAELDWRETLNV